jgi:hypothetical protein
MTFVLICALQFHWVHLPVLRFKNFFIGTYLLYVRMSFLGSGCVGLFLGFLFYSRYIWFCASAMLFLLIWLCSIIWSQVLWYLQHCSFCSGLFWLFRFFPVSIKDLLINFSMTMKNEIRFLFAIDWVCRLLSVIWLFSHTSANRWIWGFSACYSVVSKWWEEILLSRIY